MPVSPNTNFTAGAVLTAAQQNNFPRGVMGYVVRDTGNIVLSTSVADVTAASVTFTAAANRGYKVTWTALVGKTGSNGQVFTFITDGSNNIQCDYIENINVGEFATIGIGFVVTGLAAGTQTLKIRAQLSTAGGTLYAASTNKYSLLVEDIGPI